MRKVLLVILSLLVVALIVMGIWSLVTKKPIFGTSTIVKVTPINVLPLKEGQEKLLGTISYPGAKTIEAVGENLTVKKGVFETTDSLDGVINIYAQDLVSRYADAKVTRQEITKADALGGKATVLTCETSEGKIIVTAWATTKGMTDFEISKE